MKIKWPKWLVGSDDFRIELFLGKDGWRHRTVCTANGQTVQTSGEAYAEKRNARDTATHMSRSSGWSLVDVGLEEERPTP